jgi:hypothetical protein
LESNGDALSALVTRLEILGQLIVVSSAPTEEDVIGIRQRVVEPVGYSAIRVPVYGRVVVVVSGHRRTGWAGQEAVDDLNQRQLTDQTRGNNIFAKRGEGVPTSPPR